jgi:PPK2 family polyphosphate:nucleotide phosphotransferase
MRPETDIIEQCRVKPGKRVRLKDWATSFRKHPDLKGLSGDELKSRAQRYVAERVAELSEAQELLYASDTHALLVVFQAMDAAGKDGTIKHVMSGVNPQGCQVYSFKQPSAEELDHTFLWRYQKAMPERGRIAIFNRSHYEDVLVVRVHPELLEKAKLPEGKRGKGFWRHRFEDINAMEHHLERNGTRVVKFFLHVSKAEQKRRFIERLEQSEKHWKFSPADVAERQHWDAYMEAYEDALEHTSTEWAPWYVVPADDKWVTRAMVSGILAHTIRGMGLEWPKVSAEQKKELARARAMLKAE